MLTLGFGLGVTHKSPGAEFGPELVPNGTFDVDVADWTSDGAGPIAWNAGTLELTATGTDYALPVAALVTISGRTYKFTVTLAGTANNANIRAGTTNLGVDLVNGGWSNGDGVHEYSFDATSSTTFIGIGVADDTIAIDDVSVREVL